MATWIRRIVSKNKKRFQDGPHGFDLDLAYISPRIIAMGLPAEGKDVLYRNPLPEIARFLHTYHHGNAKVYNLCSEHKYSPQKLLVPLQHYPFDDHQTPALCMVQHFCTDAAAWLAANPLNVIAVHCKAGKGRTGIMICCLMLYMHINAPTLANLPDDSSTCSSVLAKSASADVESTAAEYSNSGRARDTKVLMPILQRLSGSLLANAGIPSPPSDSSGSSDSASAGQLAGSRVAAVAAWHPWQSVQPLQLQQLANPGQDVLDLYAERRTHDGNGVSIPSQRRYVGYFWSVLSSGPRPLGSLPQPRTVQIRQLQITGLPLGTAEQCMVVVEARHSGSHAASASRVFMSPVQKAPSSSMQALCMAPCAMPPQVQDDTCKVITTPAGDRLTIKLPAASMGLSLLAHRGISVLQQQQASADADVNTVSSCSFPATGTASSCCCVCLGTHGATTTGRPADGSFAGCHQCESGCAAVAAGPPAGALGAALAGGTYTVAADEGNEFAEQPDRCIVEGDVRILVLRGGVRLFYTWFNTAFLPAGGCYTLPQHQLDKVAKSMPKQLSLTVKYVDMQPHATDGQEDEATAEQDCLEAEQTQHQQLQQHQWQKSVGMLESNSSSTCDAPASKAAQLQQQRQDYTAHAPAAVKLTTSERSIGLAHVCGASAAYSASKDGCSMRLMAQGSGGQQQQHSGSASAPASPQSGSHGKVGRKSSWHHHLPSISSISTSALVSGSGIVTEDEQQSGSAAASDFGVPHFWDWDWDHLAAAKVTAAGRAASNAAAASSETAIVADATWASAAGGAQRKPGNSQKHRKQQQLSQEQLQQCMASQLQRPQQQLQHSPFARQHWHTVSSQQSTILPEPSQGAVQPVALGVGHKGARSGGNITTSGIVQSSSRVASKLAMYGRSPVGIELPTVTKRPATAAAPDACSLLQTPAAGIECVGNATMGVPYASAISGSVKHTANGGTTSDSSSFASSHRRSFSSLWQALQQQSHKDARRRQREVRTATAAVSTPSRINPDAAVDDADDASDGGDVFAADLLGLEFAPEGSRRLLPSAASAPVSAAVLEAAADDLDPLEGLLEALNWSTDTWRHQGSGFSSSKQKQQQRKAYSIGRLSFSNPSSACSSRASSPIAQQHHSNIIAAPCTPQPHGRSRVQGSSCKESTSKPQSPTSLLDLDKEHDAGAVAVAVQTVENMAGSSAASKCAGAVKAAAAQAQAATDTCCLHCVFGLHTGPCPATEVLGVRAAAAKADALPITAATSVLVPAQGQVITDSTMNRPGTTENHNCRTAEGGAAATGLRASMQHPAMQPCRATNSSKAAAISSTGVSAQAQAAVGKLHQQLPCADSGVTRPLPGGRSSTSGSHAAISWYGAAGGFSSSSGRVRRAMSSPAGSKENGAPVVATPPAVLAAAVGAKHTAGQSVGYAAAKDGDGTGMSTQPLARAWSTSTASAAAAAAARANATRATAAAADDSNHSSNSSACGSSSRDELLQGLLRPGMSASNSSGDLRGRGNVAGLVQRWEQIESAWQRSWWV